MKALMGVLLAGCVLVGGCDGGDAMKILGGAAAGFATAKIIEARRARTPISDTRTREEEIEKLRRENAELRREIKSRRTSCVWL